MQDTEAVALAAGITIAWLGNPANRTDAAAVGDFLRATHASLTGLGQPDPVAEQPSAFEPAVSVRQSTASREYLVSLIDGKRYKTLKRHLSLHGLTPDQYRERYGLKPDYPMTAPAYSEMRSSLAKSNGLGRSKTATEVSNG